MLLGKKTVVTGSPSGVVTLEAPVGAGASVVLTVIWSNDSPTVPTIVSVVDSRGNTYSVDAAAGTGNGTVSGAIITGAVTTALRVGDTITVTISTNRQRWVLRADSMPALGPVDRTAVNNTPGVSAAMTTGVTAKTRTRRQLVVALFGFGRGGLADSTLPDGWDGGAYITTAAGSADRALQLGYRVVEVEGTQEGTATLTVPAAYSACIATYPVLPAFPDVALKVDVEFQIGDTWERVSGDVLTDGPVQIERGRPDEAGTIPASKLGLTLRNTGGKYSPRNPRSPYYGLIGRNTPIRVSVDHPDLPDPAPYAYLPGLEFNYLATPDAPALDLTDVVDVRLDVTPDSWRPDITTVLASKMDRSTGNDSWTFMLRGDGRLRLRWTADGSTGVGINSTTAVAADSGRLAVRAVFNGADPGQGGNRSVTFYTGPSVAGPWTQLGDVLTGAASSVYAGTAALEIATGMGGTRAFVDCRVLHGRVHDFQLVNGAGTVVADPGISALTDLSGPDWTGPDGLPWVAYGAARILTGGPAHRFCGEVSEWPPHWSLGGHRQTIPIQAAGIKRRLGQGAAPVQSPLRRSIPATPGLVAYWPMEEPGGHFASATPGASELRVTSGTIAYASDDTFPGSAPLPAWGTGRAYGRVADHDASADQPQGVLMLMRMPTEPTGSRLLVAVITDGGSVRRWDMWYSPGSHSLAMTAYDQDGNKVIADEIANVPALDLTQQVAIWLEQPDPDTVWMTVVGLPLGADMTQQWTAGADGHTVGRITQVIVGDPKGLEDLTIGHIMVCTGIIGMATIQPQILGYPGEAAGARLARLAAENDVPLQIVGQLGDMAAMGPQRSGTLLDLLEECADADGGALAESRDEAGLLYRSRASLYNQPPALELAYGQPGLAAPFEPVDDDQAVRNRVTVSREGGSSATVEATTGPLSIAAPPDGVGIYDDSVTVNVATDGQLPDQAGWRLHLGTWDESRYPALGVKLHKAPTLIPAAAAMDLGDRATVADLPEWLPPAPADGIVQGYTETIELLRWRIDCNATPAGPWQVAVRDGGTRRDGDGSTLAAAVGAADTAWSVASPNVLWTTDPADFPFDLAVGGEVVTVTAITGTSSPQALVVVRAVNGISKSHPAGSVVRLAAPLVRAL